MTRAIRRFDPVVFWAAIAATALGCLVIFDAGYARSLSSGKGVVPREFWIQAISAIAAVGIGILVSRSGLQRLYDFAKPVWWLTLVALAGLMIPGLGTEMNGAHRWYKLGPITIQPAEFAKYAVIVYIAAVMHHRKAWPAKRYKSIALWLDSTIPKKMPRLIPAVWVLIGVGLIAIEPDLGTAAVVAAIGWVCFAAGGVTRKSMVVGTLLGLLACAAVVKMEPYRVERITNHAHRWDKGNMDDTGFQTTQSELAMASGGIVGVGIGAGRAKHIMPAATTDFVGATVAEELGLIGWLLTIAPLGVLTWRFFVLAGRAPTRFGAIIQVGLGSWIGVQSVVNILMANGTWPAIGIPLPFISSGGSSLVAMWIALGVSAAAMQPILARKEATVEADRDGWRHGRPRLSGA